MDSNIKLAPCKPIYLILKDDMLLRHYDSQFEAEKAFKALSTCMSGLVLKVWKSEKILTQL